MTIGCFYFNSGKLGLSAANTRVACSGKKTETAAPARELYLGQLFKKSVAYIEAVDPGAVDPGAPWFILSALHALVLPDEVIAPYEYRLKTKRPRQTYADRAHSNFVGGFTAANPPNFGYQRVESGKVANL
jgi:hypothetical protein